MGSHSLPGGSFPGIEPGSSALQVDSLLSEPPGKPECDLVMFKCTSEPPHASVTPPRLPVKVLPTGPRPSLASPTYSLDSPPMCPPVWYATSPLLGISSDLGLQWLGAGPGFPARGGLGSLPEVDWVVAVKAPDPIH